MRSTAQRCAALRSPLSLQPRSFTVERPRSAAQITLRTLNAAQSAFVVFKLSSTFFAEYLVHASAAASVKLHLKNVVSIFRSTNGVTRVWLQLACSEPDAQAYMRVQLQCASGIRKKFDIALKEARALSRPPPTAVARSPAVPYFAALPYRPVPRRRGVSGGPARPSGDADERRLFARRLPAPHHRRPGQDHQLPVQLPQQLAGGARALPSRGAPPSSVPAFRPPLSAPSTLLLCPPSLPPLALSTFRRCPALPQVTLVATSENLHLKNDADGSANATQSEQKEAGALRTEMTLPAADLHSYELTLSALRGVRRCHASCARSLRSLRSLLWRLSAPLGPPACFSRVSLGFFARLATPASASASSAPDWHPSPRTS